MNEFQAIGCGILGFGVAFFILGVFTLLNRQFLVTSNVLILIGANLIFGVRDFFRFVIQKNKLTGSLAFFLGIALVFAKLPLPGIIAEVVGAYWLFGGFIQLLLSIITKIPFVGAIIPSSWRKENLDV